MPTILTVLFIIALLPIVPAWLSGYFRHKELGKIDNKNPRGQQGSLTGAGARAVAAQNNSWEALQLFITTVVIAFASGLDLYQLTTVSLIFLAARVAYLFAYIANYDIIRSTLYMVALGCCVYIFYLSASSF